MDTVEGNFEESREQKGYIKKGIKPKHNVRVL